MPYFELYGETDLGLVRRNNEDSLDYFSSEADDLALAVVADGVGGSPGGELASELAVRTVLESVRRHIRALPESGQALAELLETAVIDANSAIRASQRRVPRMASMATTVVTALAHGNVLALVHAGDSRCYRLRGEEFTALTEDHTVAQQMLNDAQLAPIELERSPYHQVLTQALGIGESPTLTVSVQEIEPGDLFLLCTDGITNHVGDSQIVEELCSGDDLPGLAKRLIACANAQGGNDNITVLLLARKPGRRFAQA